VSSVRAVLLAVAAWAAFTTLLVAAGFAGAAWAVGALPLGGAAAATVAAPPADRPASAVAGETAPDELPLDLADTGLYRDRATLALSAGLIAFAPQYPLWSDGASKHRWLRLPPGASIDASNPDAWAFPVGTRLWKEFRVGGRRVETRVLDRTSAGWRYASYVWDAAGARARRAPSAGATVALDGADEPGRAAPRWHVPGADGCLACHDGALAPVLGFAALQLAGGDAALAVVEITGEETPLAAAGSARGLQALVERGWLRGLPPPLLATPPRIAAADAATRDALGHLHGNCGHCHHAGPGRVPVRLTLAQSVADPVASLRRTLASAVGAPTRTPLAGADRLVVAGDPDASALLRRLSTRDPRLQMPPLGTDRPDPEGQALVSRWIHQLTPPPEEHLR
jgi:hypothetical protein